MYATAVGDVPRGFYELRHQDCQVHYPHFVRGLLVDRPWMESHRDEYMEMWSVPRYWLYGGPVDTRIDAEELNNTVWNWARVNNLEWFPSEVVCIPPERLINWPADRSFRWDWVWEPERPSRVARSWGGRGYEWRWV